ncbi:MAG TPA: hypothetical protein EYP65_06610 [Armatimonadetes bacterium]|nr:hypothetical protein [Armatimonadota bacterium]
MGAEKRSRGGICGERRRKAAPEAEKLSRFENALAEEHFSLARSASPAVRPLLLFYGLFHLAKATYATLTGRPFRERVHGLTCRFPKGREPSSISEVRVGLKAKGAFRLFESLYDPHPIPAGVSFSLEELIEGKGHAAKIPSLSRHYLALFGLSIVARYEPQLWEEALAGEDPTSAALLSYLERVAEECRREVASVVERRYKPQQ